MNLVEAVKSGKYFKRKNATEWRDPNTSRFQYIYNLDQILADDWEVKEDPPKKERWLAWGIHRGTHIQFWGYAPASDPLVYNSNGKDLATRLRHLDPPVDWQPEVKDAGGGE